MTSARYSLVSEVSPMPDAQRWARYDKWGFSVAWCPDGDRYYWHVYHAQYGVRWGYELSQLGCHHQVNWTIGDMRQRLAS
jgi:hypothetical protein